MTDLTDRIRAPQDAIAWTPDAGFIYDDSEVRHVEAGEVVLTVSSDGRLRGVQPHDSAPLRGLLRVEVDVTEICNALTTSPTRSPASTRG